MEAYQYKYGDRPLEGYTIQRAAGRGGFGEVYYAISDSGRQVALKVVQSHEQIELRGISQCMNLKSPHLVTVFDVKYNDQNRPFVIMEYVSGPSLSDLLKESPGGLGTQKAAFFLREIGKGLSYLHECGIVHRDLKPSNIFYENGYAKIGDYGLTKAMSTSRHVSHTITVGTVHYMAPEIGAGRYDRSVDIYALGVLLYEMLTGQVPFLGASPAEILMKHMSATADLSHIEEPFARVIRKALAKDPAERYQTVQAMVEDVFGAEHIRNSVSQFSPEELSVVAEHVAQKMGRAQPAAGASRPAGAKGKDQSDFSKEIGKKAERLAQKAEQFAKKAEVFSGQVADKFKAAKERAHETGQKVVIADPLVNRQRRTLALTTAAVVAFGAGILNQREFFPAAVAVFVMIGVASKVILRSRRKWWAALDQESRWLGKTATCFGAAFLAVLVANIVGGLFGGGLLHRGGGGFSLPFGPFRHLPFVQLPFVGGKIGGQGGQVLALALPMLLVDWLKITDAQRAKRVDLGHAIWVGFLGMVAGSIFDLPAVITACALAGIVLVVQAISPVGQPISGAAAAQARGQRQGASASGVVRPVRPYARTLWLIGSLVAFGLGLFLCILAGTSLGGDDFALAVAFGVDSFIVSAFCFIMICRTTFAGWYRYLVRPLILLGCVLTVVTASMKLRGDGEAIAIFFIIFPSPVFVAFLFLPPRLFGAPDAAEVRRKSSRYAVPPSGSVSSRKRLTALLIALIPFVMPFAPVAGMQRFYVGKVGTGILWLFTWGLFGIGQVIDIIMIATGQFRDNYGLPLVVWSNRAAAAKAGVHAQTPPAPVVPAEAGGRQAEPVRQAVEEPGPAVEPPSSSPSYANTGTVVYEPWHPFSGLLAGLGHLLVFVAFLIGMILALEIPMVVSLGFPNPSLAHEVERILGPDWVGGMENMCLAAGTIVFLIGAVLIIIGRRVHGISHILRALVGLGGVAGGVMFMIDELFNTYQISQNPPATIMEFLQHLRIESLAIGGIIIVVSLAMLAWPPRRRQPVFAPMPMPNQGVSV